MNPRKLLPQFFLLLLCFAVHRSALADTTTFNGAFTTDNQVFQYNFSSASTQNFIFSTNSYSTGGFVPVLTLFSSTGQVLGNNGGSGMCIGSAVAGSTGLCNDAFLSQTLSNGSYILDLTEFPNVAVGNLSDGFLFAGSPHITGDLCGVAGGTFLETDLPSCVQRTGNYSLNINNVATAATPEPATWMLVLPATGLLFAFGKRSIA